jgi:hypothetical protein
MDALLAALKSVADEHGLTRIDVGYGTRMGGRHAIVGIWYNAPKPVIGYSSGLATTLDVALAEALAHKADSLTRRYCLSCRGGVIGKTCPQCDEPTITFDELSDLVERQAEERADALNGGDVATLDEQHARAWEHKQSLRATPDFARPIGVL